MAYYGKKSRKRLNTCHPDWHIIMGEVIKIIDNSIIEGHRGRKKQNRYFSNGTSKVKWPDGNHNTTPSMAIDAAPWPEIYDDWGKCYFFAGIVLGVADRLLKEGKVFHKVGWGGDWDGDKNLKDQSFFDLVHFWLIPL